MTKAKSGNSIVTMMVSLVIAVLLLAGLIVGAFVLSNGAAETTDDELIALIACNAEDVKKISIDSPKDTYTIVQNGYKDDIIQWKIDNQDNTDVDQYSLKLLVNRCQKLNARRDLGSIDTSNTEQMELYGFNEPLATFSVEYTDGVRTFVLGDVYAGEYYMYEKGTSKLYVAPSTVGTYMSITSNELRALPALSVSMGNIGVIGMVRKGQPDISLAYMPSLLSDTRSWQLLSPVGGYTDSTNIESFISAISDFQMSAYIAPQLGGDLEKYGFDDAYASILLAPPIVSEEDKEAVADLPSQLIVVGDPMPDYEGYRYCYTYTKKEGETADIASCKVYAISEEVFNGIFGVNPINLLDKQVILTNIVSVEKIALNIQGKESTIIISNKTLLDDDGKPIKDAEGATQYQTSFDLDDGTRLHESSARSFYTRLISLKVVAFLREDDPQEVGEKLFSVTLHTDIKPFGVEDTDVTVDISAEVYELDSNYCIIRFGGQTDNVCKMTRAQIFELFDAYDLMLKGELPGVRD